jgi:hypothetical protein
MGAAHGNDRIGEPRGAVALDGCVEKRRFRVAIDALELLGMLSPREWP